MTRNTLRLFFPWAALLVLFFTSSVLSQQNEDKKLRAQEFVSSYELRLQGDLKLLDRFYILVYLAPAALAAGDAKKAEKYAFDLQTTAEEMRKTSRFYLSEPEFGTHISNTILGLIAFDEGNITQAKEHLLTAAELVGRPYPTLGSFGPNMLLAKKLIESGELETVIRYLDLCARFWINNNGRLKKWKDIINKGGMPDFGANLLYVVETWRYRQI